MSSSGPDLFVVCKNCGSEVSPYITECPYCGSRLRKRAPKIDREGRPAEKPKRRLTPSLPPMRRGEIPGIRVEGRPWATGVLVLASLILLLVYRAGLVAVDVLVIDGSVGDDWWRVFTASFVYDSLGYAFVALLAIAVFGWLLERRHGSIPVILLSLSAAGFGMLAVSAVGSFPTAAGGNAVALALLCAWVVPPLLEMRRGEDVDADMLGVLVIALALLALPIAVAEASPLAAVAGALVGLLAGLPLARLKRGY
ncbi:MAG: rhomboid family intramembrane serine protease [Solirubrobacteraceae bacterium]